MADTSVLERVVSVTLTIATLAVAIVVVERRLRPPKPPTLVARVEQLKNWKSLSAGAELALGDTSAKVDITVFTDFECPFCQRLDTALMTLERTHAGQIARSLVHFPLPNHRFAMPAAVASECAAEQGRGREMHDALFSRQTAIGTRAWSEFALDAGVADLPRFEACTSTAPRTDRIQRGMQLATSLKISGTPAVVINGWLFDPAEAGAVGRAIEAILAGRSPQTVR